MVAVCMVEGCKRKPVREWRSLQGLFGGRKQGMFIITWSVCAKHRKEINRGVELRADLKRLLQINPHLKGAV